ncbi:juvenile hormone esterase-like isoform X2 [Tigriopus californicus]|nr:juvenile hormone esterase-like isoform X2 [Tigriopus californicus]
MAGYSTFLGSEDCLKLNVYFPNIELTKRLPVMFWIHGGGFVNGDATDFLYGPGHLLDRDVILVTVAYRLGPLGFLNLGNEEIPGNQGIWDQRLALKWVQENIAAFGGDRDQVTIFGESAGSMSVMYHMATPGSDGLFSAAIAQSGSITGAAFLNFDKTRSLTHYHQQYTQGVGCPESLGAKEQRKCLESLDLATLMDKLNMFEECSFMEPILGSKIVFPAAWKPAFDGNYLRDPLFPEDPTKVIESGRTLPVPLMIGFNRDEGLLTLAFMLKNRTHFQRFTNDWESCLIINAFGKRAQDLNKNDVELAKQLTQFYFPEKNNPDFELESHIPQITDFFTDGTFSHTSDVTSRQIALHGEAKVFYYVFAHQGQRSVEDFLESSLPGVMKLIFLNAIGINPSKKMGVCHADDLPYLFSSTLPMETLDDPQDVDISRKLVDLWTNFAIHRHPTPRSKDGNVIGPNLQDIRHTWKSVQKQLDLNEAIYYTLDSNGFRHEPNADLDNRLRFWEKMTSEKLKW